MSLGRGTPVERRKRLRGFKWSSYGGYAGLSAPFSFVQEARVLGELRGPGRAERLRYRRFVEEGLLREIANPFEAVQWQAALGDESFVQKLRDRLKGLHKQRREMTSVRKAMASIDPERILQRVSEKYQVARERLVSPRQRGLYPRNLAMWMIWRAEANRCARLGNFSVGWTTQRWRNGFGEPAPATTQLPRYS